MRSRRIPWFVAALFALLAPLAARAQGTLTFPNGLDNPVAASNYVGPFAGASFVNSVGQSQVLAVICVDLANHVGFGDRYAVSVNNLGYTDDLAESRHPGAMLTYRKAAWLGSLFGTTPRTADGWGSVQYAIWNLFTPVEAPEYGQSNDYLALADRAAANGFGAFTANGVSYAAVDMSRYWILTDVAAYGRATGGRQEFIAMSTTPLVSVPEPGTLLLVATGVLGVVGLILRERREQRRNDALRPGHGASSLSA